MTIDNLCKLFHDIIIIPFSTPSLQKIEYLCNDKSILDEIKKIYFFSGVSFGEILKK